MGTYAHYRVWIGILTKDVESLSPALQEFFDRVNSTTLGVKQGSLHFKTMYMHGESIGHGVECKDLEWITAGEEPEEVDRFFYFRELGKLHLRVQTTLQLIDMDAVQPPVKIYHYIDLGG